MKIIKPPLQDKNERRKRHKKFKEERAEREKCVQILLKNGFDLGFINNFTHGDPYTYYEVRDNKVIEIFELPEDVGFKKEMSKEHEEMLVEASLDLLTRLELDR